MHVAIVTAGLGAGGAERVISLLAHAWNKRGSTVTIICFDRPGTVPFYAFPKEVSILQLGGGVEGGASIAGPAKMLLRALRLRRVLKSQAPDVVISFLTKINVLTLLANHGKGSLPHLICERNNPERQTVRGIWRRLQELLARRATLVLQTEESRTAFPKELARRALVIPNPMAPPSFEANHALKSIVAVGRLVEQKGFDLLLNAFAQIADRRSEWSLVIWGDGPARAGLERQRDLLGLQKRVSLPGLTRRPGEWLTSGSVFALSSRYEGFPNVLVEAMSAGMGVVTFACPWGPAEIVEHNKDGLLVPPEDVAALAAGLEGLMTDDALRPALGQRARISVERFSLENVLVLWDQAVARAQAQRPRRIRRPHIPADPKRDEEAGWRYPLSARVRTAAAQLISGAIRRQ